jgi:DNA-binding MarR family transcriptional regulator
MRLQRAVRASTRTHDPAAQLIASALAEELQRTGGLPCRPSLQRLAALSGVHPARVEQALKTLERSGIVARLRVQGAPDVDHFALLCDVDRCGSEGQQR